ncbi:MAG: tol-pal system protein YbgF [Gammaproteobacteria bacterium]|nr:tol-pal system protein YbgF [Gammaproteobacteria bacterium]
MAQTAVPVEDRSDDPSGAPPQDPAYVQPAPQLATELVAAAPDGRLNEVFYQLQLLQQEVQQLRGMMEEQTYRMNRFSREQRERYMDVDRRLAALNGRTPTASVASVASTDGAAFSVSDATERDAYTSAFNLMKRKEFSLSIEAFDKLIVDYPNGQYTPNAFYWLGELHLAGIDLEQARQSFVQVITLYPDHNKVPDTLYKLGVVYHRLGDANRSLEYLDRVVAEHPGATASGLAKSYAAELR